MALCSSCSAPLPADTSFCSYCGTRNDLDVLAMPRFAESREISQLHCPDCKLPMETIRLGTDDSFAVERCPTCFGLFFDPGEVQAFLEATVAPTFLINHQEINNINRERANKDHPVRYLPCPVCGKFMNRTNLGANSGVVIDQCRRHGVWLDNGELIHLMEWKRAGGQLRAEVKVSDSPKYRTRAERGHASLPLGMEEPMAEQPLNELLNSAINLLGRLFG